MLSGNKVTSTTQITPVLQQDVMKKLNKKKIKWIVREVERRDKGVWTIAQIQNITKQHAYRVHKKYRDIKDPVMKKCGRKPRLITNEERKIIVDTFHEFRVGATMIEQILDEKDIHINHNRIHRVLLEEGLAKQEFRKKKKRNWIRYERRHSLSLVHSDWFEFKGKKAVIFIDDASRFITGCGEFKNADAKNTIKVFKQSLK